MGIVRALDPVVPPLCSACGGWAGRAEPLCPGCRAALPWLARGPVVTAGVETWAAVAYRGPARALVAQLKRSGCGRLAGVLAAQLAAGVPEGWLAGAVLVPVPLTRSRRRRRGYNQSELLATALACRTGLGVADCLARRGRGGPQVGRGRAARQLVAGTVLPRPRALVPGRALLVDDVVTTGATLAACAGALRAGGATEVRALAYARTSAR